MVDAQRWNSMNMSWNLNFFSGPKGVMRCGKCGADSQHRLPLINTPRIVCPHCKEVNKINVQYGLF